MIVDRRHRVAAATAITYCAAAAAWKFQKYVGYNRGYNHIFCSLVVPQVTVTQSKNTLPCHKKNPPGQLSW